MRSAGLWRHCRRRVLRRLRIGAGRGNGFRLAAFVTCRRRSAERRDRAVGNHPSRSGSPRFSAIQRRQPSDAATDRDNADIAPRRRPHPGPIGTGHRSASGVDGPGDGCGRQAILLGVWSTCRSIARRCGGTVERLLPEVSYSVRLRPEAAARCAGRWPVRGGRWPRPRRHGLDLPRQRSQRQRSLGRAEGLVELGRPRRGASCSSREAIPRRGRASAHRRDLQLRHRCRRGLVHRHGIRRRPLAEHHPQGSDEGHRPVLADPRRPGDRLHRRDPPGVLVSAPAGPAVLRLQAGQHHPGRRRPEADRSGWRAADRR